MSDTASGSHRAQSSPADGASTGSKGSYRKPLLGGNPLRTEQPTVISSQPPLSTPSQAEDPLGTKPDRLSPGACLGPFELVEYVGGGGMGHVYRATDNVLGRTVALKILSTEQIAEPDTLMRFRNEARSAARLNHENIVQVYCAGEEQGLSYIAFEFIEGTNVRQLVQQNGPLSLAEALSYTLQIAEALAYANRQNVVHRDIKPSNVLITPEGRAKLIDMGLARLQGPREADDLTASGVTLGTFDYISPEQARDPRNADARSDIYSLGCTLFFMLAGRPPFPEGTVLQKLLQHQGDEPPDVRQFRPDLPDDLSYVLRRMMAKSPQQRYQDPARLIEALLVLVQKAGLQPAGPGQRMWVAPRPSRTAMIQRHLPWMAPVAILIASVLMLHFLSEEADYQSTHLAESTVASAESNGKSNKPAAVRTSPKASASATEIPSSSAPNTSTAAPVPSASPAVTAAGPAAPTTPTPGSALAPQGAAAPSSSGGTTVPTVAGGAQSNRPAAQQWAAATSEAHASAAPPTASGISLAHSGRPSATGPTSQAPATDSASTGPSTPSTVQNRVLVVDGRGQAGAFPTLKAACSAAAGGDVIELRYSGRIEPETPMTLTNLQLTICAGNGFRPAVTFRPNESDPVRYSRSMFSLIGSRVRLQGIAVELSIPEDLPPDSWTLFDVDQAEVLELRQCWLTIRNAAGGWAAYHPDVAFLRLKASPLADSVLAESFEQRRVTVTLEDCAARGEATFLRNEGMQPIQLQWNNGLLSTTEWLLSADGSDTFRPSYTMQIALDHLTAMIGRGLCQFNHSDYMPDQLANFRASNSILLGSGASVLIEQNGVLDLEKARRRILWAGDRNFYEGFRIFWSISPRDASKPSEQLNFNDWRGYWTQERESNARCDQTQWKRLPQKNRPVHAHTSADFVLDETPTNPAIKATANSENAGMALDRLPQPPPVPDLFRAGSSGPSSQPDPKR